VDISKLVIVFVNNAVGTVIIGGIALAAYLTGGGYLELGLDWGLFLLVFSSLLGTSLGYCGMMVQTYISATSFLVLSNVNKFFIIFVGILVWHENAGFAPMLGCVLAIGGAVWYSRVQKTPKGQHIEVVPTEDEKAGEPGRASEGGGDNLGRRLDVQGSPKSTGGRYDNGETSDAGDARDDVRDQETTV